MGSADGERLATVTWLFGSPDVPVTSESSPSAFRDRPSDADAARLDAAREALQAATSAAEQEQPKQRASFDRISNVSMHALARRGMSSQEMRQMLLHREFEPSEVEIEIDRLESVGLLDDAALAETLLRTLRERKGLGRTALSSELKRRHLHPDAVAAALAELDDELDRAIELAERRAPQLRSLDHETAKRRLSAFLMRKGYSGGVVSTAVARALEPSGPRFR